MIKATGKIVKVLKIKDIAYNGKHPNDINTGSERTGKAMNDVKVDEALYIQTERGLFHTSTVTKVNEDGTFNTMNSLYSIEIIDNDASLTTNDVKSVDDKSKRKPLPNRVYLHYRGGLYEVLHLAKSSIDNSDQVVYKSLHYGSYHTRPLSEWFDVKVKKETNGGHRDILRFELYNG